MTAPGKLLALRRVAGQPDELTDEALVASCALGDQAAMGALIDRFHRPLYRFVSRLLGSDGNDRDDVVQATFAEIAGCAARFRRDSSVRVWIFGIAANISKNQIRTLSRRRRMETALAAVPSPRATRPDDEAQRNQLLRKLATALADLPHDLRTAFVMCDLEDLTARDAAAALGVREGTVWRRVHDARRALREALEGTS